MSVSLSGKTPRRNVRARNEAIKQPSASPDSPRRWSGRVVSRRGRARDGFSFGCSAVSGGLSVDIRTLREHLERPPDTPAGTELETRPSRTLDLALDPLSNLNRSSRSYVSTQTRIRRLTHGKPAAAKPRRRIGMERGTRKTLWSETQSCTGCSVTLPGRVTACRCIGSTTCPTGCCVL